MVKDGGKFLDMVAESKNLYRVYTVPTKYYSTILTLADTARPHSLDTGYIPYRMEVAGGHFRVRGYISPVVRLELFNSKTAI